MKNSILTFGLLFMALVSFGQMNNNDNNTRTMGNSVTLEGFDKIAVKDGIKVVLEFGNTEAIRIEGNGVSDQDIKTTVFFDKLTIEREGRRNTDVTAYVTYKNLKKVIAGDGSSVEASGLIDMDSEFEIEARDGSTVKLDVTADEVEVDVEGNSRVELNAHASEVEASVSSSSTMVLTGSGKELQVDASGSGQFEGYDFNAIRADLAASNGANIQVNVSEKMDAEADNGGNITYRGNPTNTKSEPSNGGTVQPAR